MQGDEAPNSGTLITLQTYVGWICTPTLSTRGVQSRDDSICLPCSGQVPWSGPMAHCLHKPGESVNTKLNLPSMDIDCTRTCEKLCSCRKKKKHVSRLCASLKLKTFAFKAGDWCFHTIAENTCFSKEMRLNIFICRLLSSPSSVLMLHCAYTGLQFSESS